MIVVGKIGWRKSFFSLGETAFSVDYTRSYNFPTRSDEGYSVGVAAVQQIDDYGVELFGIYRLYSLDLGDDPKVDDINVVSLGARVKF